MTGKKTKSAQLLQRAYDLKSSEETQELYRDWASTYDETMVDGLTYNAPDKVAALLADHVADKEILVADIGCGTGLTGQGVADRGFKTIDGLDFSKEMLAVSAKRGIYRKLINVDLTKKIDIASDTYGAAVSSGIFTYGHLDATCLDEIIRIIKPGGLFACVVRTQVWQPLGFAERFAELEQAGSLLRLQETLDTNYENSEQVDGRYLLFKIT